MHSTFSKPVTTSLEAPFMGSFITAIDRPNCDDNKNPSVVTTATTR